ncbi:MAG TPA: uroporphyrinogen-III synthase [Blastocatellia bacterium]|nr:uroporphyrinogen-III synthase [Blastocatellia bacterium]
MDENRQTGSELPGDVSRPLRGKRILVTRTKAQSEAITTQLESLGATVVHCPTIEIIPPSSWEPLDDAIARINEYNWLVFTSSNAVRYFFARLNVAYDKRDIALGSQRICAIGPATAAAITEEGAPVHVTAADSVGEGALQAIIEAAGGDQNLKGLRILLPRARAAREFLPAALRNLGAHVDAVEAYRTIKPKIDSDNIFRLFTESSIDAVTFTSSSTVKNFAELAGLTDLSDLLSGIVVACIGPVTADTAAAHGLKQVVQPAEFNSSALVDALVAAIGSES